MQNELRAKLKRFIMEELARDSSDVDVESAPLVEVGIIDSLGIMKLVQFLESEFGVHISDEELLPENFENLDAIQKLTAAKQAG